MLSCVMGIKLPFFFSVYCTSYLFIIPWWSKAKKKTLSENAGDEKNLHPGGWELFLISWIELIFLNKVHT